MAQGVFVSVHRKASADGAVGNREQPSVLELGLHSSNHSIPFDYLPFKNSLKKGNKSSQSPTPPPAVAYKSSDRRVMGRTLKNQNNKKH